MELFLYEFRKITLKKSVIIALILFSIIDVYKISIEFNNTGRINNDYNNGYWKAYKKAEGVMNDSSLNFVIDGYKRNSEIVQSGNYDTEHKQSNTYTGFVFGDMNMFKELFDAMDYQYNYNKVIDGCVDIAEDNIGFYQSKNNQYEVLNNRKIVKTYKGRNITEFYDTDGFSKYFHYDFSSLLILCLLILGLVPVFSYEREIEMDKLLLTSKNGRQRTVLAKISAAFVFIVIVSLILFIIDFAGFSYFFKLLGAGNPIYSIKDFKLSPLTITIFEYIFLSGILKLLGFLVIGSVILTCSSMFSDALFPFVLSSGIIALLIVLSDFDFLFNSIMMLKNRVFLMDYQVTNLFGNPVLSLTIMIIIMLISLFVLIFAVLLINMKNRMVRLTPLIFLKAKLKGAYAK